ncbi:MAG: hypothetical protein OEQ29_21915 [Alphaproteobacteria bacterium]|nr:hypothetical protein [Alphaproteobacteria bacterium]
MIDNIDTSGLAYAAGVIFAAYVVPQNPTSLFRSLELRFGLGKFKVIAFPFGLSTVAMKQQIDSDPPLVRRSVDLND